MNTPTNTLRVVSVPHQRPERNTLRTMRDISIFVFCTLGAIFMAVVLIFGSTAAWNFMKPATSVSTNDTGTTPTACYVGVPAPGCEDTTTTTTD